MTDFSDILLITDLDGTFFGAGGKLVPRNLEARARFRAGGGRFTIATGRLHLNIRGSIPHPEELLSAPAVMCNGAYLYDFGKKEVLMGEMLPPEITRELLRFSREKFPHVQFRVSTPTELRIEEATGYLARDISNYDKGALLISRPAENWRNDDWFKIVYRDTPETLERMRMPFEAEFGGRLSITRSGTHIIEVQQLGCTKAHGIEKLRTLMSGAHTARKIIACGDFDNDIAMLQAADLAVSPANAQPDVKAVADAVLCDCNEGLIADVIERLEKGSMEV